MYLLIISLINLLLQIKFNKIKKYFTFISNIISTVSTVQQFPFCQEIFKLNSQVLNCVELSNCPTVGKDYTGLKIRAKKLAKTNAKN